MNDQKTVQNLLDQMPQPGFCVKENTIFALNQAAQAMTLRTGDPVAPLLSVGCEDYALFSGGTMYLTLEIAGQPHSASVLRMEDMDLFLLEQADDTEEFQAMSLVSMELRRPLTNVITSARQLMAEQDLSDPAVADCTARMNQGLMQLMRLVCNLSDAGRYRSFARKETRDASAFFLELFEKAETLTANTGLRLSREVPRETIFTLMDPEQLERAVWNLISNAVKFTPRGGHIQLKLSRRGRRLFLTIADSGSGIAENVRATLFRRYQRTPEIEDSRFGLGLGMVIVRSAAANHGGTVLVDQPEGTGTRFTMTLAIEQSKGSSLCSPMLYPDYSSGWDHGLVELADCLPPDLYEKL